MDQVIVVGGGLAGYSAAHTVLEQGGRVLLLDKMPFSGGNSVKATSGMNGAGTSTQRAQEVMDSPELFEADSMRGGATRPDLVRVLTHESGDGIEWLKNSFGLDLSLLSRLGGHSAPRTHRGAEKFPGMTITYALMEKLEDIEEESDKAVIMHKTKVNSLIKAADGSVIGVEYETADGKQGKAYGPVVLATGGFGADFTEGSLLQQHRPDLAHLPSTNGEHTTGDGIKMAVSVGGDTVDLEWVQVHPTGLVHPEEPDSKIKFLAAEALRGVGGILLDKNGKRFANELGRRDYVTGRMWKSEGPFRLVLNGKSSKEITWHCKHYMGRGLMKHYKSGEEMAKDMGVDPKVVAATFAEYNDVAAKMENAPAEGAGEYEAYPTGKSHDKWGKKFFHNLPLDMNDQFHVSIVTPVIHYSMGGVAITDAAEVKQGDSLIPGLYAAGEVAGGIHGENRLGGSSLLDCVVYGRVAGRSAARHLLQTNIAAVQKNGLMAKL
mmetsp:Transcript_50774/g.115420  ORF Transcript_50774/g.115420 Transcript_50774/m.115420 type:complete len:492 (+) Transcript_50774:81-1556(+)|eukprot:CAMPEP_0204251632 /NCGR_PEP_ID=MMETSP0468-20130131/440_1 /ASSEMBLY_ACC=CAM_ASM_000383 /TAXON_ID=2969 /ORGANISM="Oxyrrhis marina" /LENGTH=491 /DNA_ID=CAMNT_0051224947 /DNA_START=52 /DNA_END=1527 /DNA_ORIENTATION=-